MDSKYEIGKYTVSESNGDLKIQGFGKNEYVCFSPNGIRCDVYDWETKKNNGLHFGKEKLCGSYSMIPGAILQKINLDTVLFYGTLEGRGCVSGKSLFFAIIITPDDKFVHLTVKLLHSFPTLLEEKELESYLKSIEIKPNDLKGRNRYRECKRLFLSIDKLSEERFFGFGEQDSSLDMSSKKIRLICDSSEKNVHTIAPLPVCISNKSRGFLLKTNAVVDVDTGKRNKEKLSFSIWNTSCDLQISCGTSFAKVVEKHSGLLCTSKRNPSWTYGTILSSCGGIENAEKKLSLCLEKEIPVSALIIEDWNGLRWCKNDQVLWNSWNADYSSYPFMEEWIEKLNGKGIKVLASISPYVSIDPDCSMYKEAYNKRFFLKKSDGSDYVFYHAAKKSFTSCQIDLTNEDAYLWFKDGIKKHLVAMGFSGWITQYPDYAPLDAVCEKGDIISYHNRFPVLWAKMHDEIVCECERNPLFVLHKSASFESCKYANVYFNESENKAKFTEISNSITRILNGGISGIPFNHTRLNYNSKMSKELFSRWIEYSAFTPFFSIKEFLCCSSSRYSFYAQDELIEFFKRFSVVHAKLQDYFLYVEEDVIKKGLPVMRPLFMQFPDDAQSWLVNFQYMVGDTILVAPVIKKGCTQKKIWFPAGRWQYAWNKKEIISTGQYINIPATVGKPPVFFLMTGTGFSKIKNLSL